MKISLCSIFVHDQQHALSFYTDTLGFVEKHNIPMGDFAWLSVAASDQCDGPELVLEPNVHPAAATFQKAIFNDGIPATSFEVEDLDVEFKRLSGLGVKFTTEPTDAGGTLLAVLDDTCGNLIQLHQTTP